jgi:hypothetical protein
METEDSNKVLSTNSRKMTVVRMAQIVKKLHVYWKKKVKTSIGKLGDKLHKSGSNIKLTGQKKYMKVSKIILTSEISLIKTKYWKSRRQFLH